jgi:hypothetical protein
MKNVFLFCCIALFFGSCSTNLVYISVTEPAPVSVPSNIKKAGIINRSIPTDDNKLLNKIDQILSVKSADLDMQGANECIRGLTNTLAQNPRFTQVTALNNITFKGSTPGMFPSPLSWDEVEKTCKQNNVDGLFVLELFYTDSKIGYSSKPITITTPLGSIPSIEHTATMTTLVKTGWRIYDPENRRIIDEYSITKDLTFTGTGINPIAAAAALLNRTEAVKQAGYAIAQQYADRIIPYYSRVTREYYVKGNSKFKIATRNARIGRWDDAAVIWKTETNNEDEKIMARACYNMAIINEINGNLDTAIDWAQKSYITGNKRLALDYVNKLKYRKRQNNRLVSQEQSGQ